MYNYASRGLFYLDGIPKNWTIGYGNQQSFGNSNIVAESIEIADGLTSNGKFILGDCVSCRIEMTVGNNLDSLKGEKITVVVWPQSQESPALLPLMVGYFKVDTDEPTADRRFRKIVAYDSLKEVLAMDVTDWYNTLYPSNTTTKTVKEITDSFFSYLGITQETQTLIGDNLVVGKEEGITQITGKQVLNAICQVNACFGHMTRYDQFRYISLGTTVSQSFTKYQKATYEQYTTDAFSKVIIRGEDNTIGVAVGQDGGSVCEIAGNFLTNKMSWADLSTCATNILNAISGITFRPAQVTTVGDPCLEVGDLIEVPTTYCTIRTYIMQRKIKGAQWLKDTITCKGEKTQKENPNSTSVLINKITGRINEIKADLVTATTVLTDEIEAAEGRIDTIEANYISAATVAATYATITDLNSATARIGTIEANYISAGTVAANYATISSLDAVSGRVGTLEATAITTSNLNAQSISGGQITSGTIDTARLNVGTIAAQTMTLSNICGVLSAPGQGTITIGTVRASSYQYYTGQGYTSLSIKTFTVNGTTYHCLGY